MDEASARYGLPLLQAGQAQKEVLHNEALVALDALIHPWCEAFGANAPPAAPEAGQAWVVGPAPLGAWAGHAGALATWTDGGWRFIAPVEGLAVRVRETGGQRVFAGGAWSGGALVAEGHVAVDGEQVIGPRAAAISTPSGGAAADVEARAAIGAILAAMRAHGLIAT